ncbi:CCA tRNA nucleotidyltransferase [Candidatus Woesearchaeota archaeon]|nr:CCA tRNA nucleotidyltransferase [Candidatus Woesearchaeota archaeon]
MFNFDFASVLSKITPTSEDAVKIKNSTKKVVSYLESAGPKNGVDVNVVAGGSTAKGTYLKGNFDVDIFVRFKTDEKNISDILELMLSEFIQNNNLILERVHGSRDYFNFEFENLFFEIVPVKYIENNVDADNVTDMSPLHVFWVKNHLTDELCNDIRLAKQFCKAIGVYGAESYINGVSGHVLDILVIHFGGFVPFLENVSLWSGATVVDPEDKHENVFEELNQSKLISPLIVIDPIDPQRNAAAAVSTEKYNLLIKHAKDFLKSPEEKYFIIPSFDIQKLISHKQNREDLFVIEVEPQKGKKDVVITKVLKIFEFLKRHLVLYDFNVHLSDWKIDSDKCYLYFFIDNQELPPTLERQGPPLENFQAVERFQEVHKDAFERDGKLWVNVRRDFTVSETCLRHLLTQEFVTQRCQNVTLKTF